MGAEYLYAQTGHVLQNVSSEQQEETPLHAIDTDEEDNEGFSCEYTISNRYNKIKLINSYNINLQLRLYMFHSHRMVPQKLMIPQWPIQVISLYPRPSRALKGTLLMTMLAPRTSLAMTG